MKTIRITIIALGLTIPQTALTQSMFDVFFDNSVNMYAHHAVRASECGLVTTNDKQRLLDVLRGNKNVDIEGTSIIIDAHVESTRNRISLSTCNSESSESYKSLFEKSLQSLERNINK